MIFAAIKNILLKKALKEYITPDLSPAELDKFGCYLMVNGKKHDLKHKEAEICLEPSMLCIADKSIDAATIEIFYTYRDTITATVLCRKKDEPAGIGIQLYEICKTSFKKYSMPALFIYYSRVCRNKAKYPFRNYLITAGLFAFPRKVILVSARCNGFVSVFPMDLQLYDPINKRYYLGLRKSNKTNSFLGDKDLKISVAEFSSKHKEAVYAFGKFHTSDFPDLRQLPYKFESTENHKNIFPDFIESYRELELISSHDLGVQYLHVLKIVHVSTFDRKDGNPLYHLHYLATNG